MRWIRIRGTLALVCLWIQEAPVARAGKARGCRYRSTGPLHEKRPESLQQNICVYIAWILRLCISSEETTSLATVGAPSTEHSMRPEWGLRGSVAFVWMELPEVYAPNRSIFKFLLKLHFFCIAQRNLLLESYFINEMMFASPGNKLVISKVWSGPSGCSFILRDSKVWSSKK